MCGIVGFVQGKCNAAWKQRSDKLTALMDNLIFLDTLRGPHATGIMRVQKGKEKEPANYYKRALAGPDFLCLPTTRRFVSGLEDASIVVGHNRYATYGGQSPDGNAHPFQYGAITLVHNGHVRNASALTPTDFQHEVDSAHVANLLSTVEDPRTVLAKLQGAYALVWHDARTGMMHIARNTDRPLYWVNLGNEKDRWSGIVFASEYLMMMAAIDRLDIPVNGEVMYPEEFKVYSFDPERSPTYSVAEYEEVKEASSSRPFPPVDRNGTARTNASSASESTSTGPVIVRQAKDKSSNRQKSRLEKSTPLLYGQLLYVKPEAFAMYKNQRNLGVVIGSIHGYDTLKIEFPNIKATDWGLLDEVGKPVICACPTNYGTGQIADRCVQGEIITNIQQMSDRIKEERAQGDGKYGAILMPGPGNRRISFEDWKNLTDDGCSHCGTNLQPDKASSISWMGDNGNQPVCKACVIDIRASFQKNRMN